MIYFKKGSIQQEDDKFYYQCPECSNRTGKVVDVVSGHQINTLGFREDVDIEQVECTHCGAQWSEF